jgi:phosphoglycerate dehydrogenase-like enzyme
MDKINVLILAPISEESVCHIREVSPRIDARFASKLWTVRNLKEDEPKDDLSNPEYEKELAWAEVLYGYKFPADVTVRAPNVKWIQSMLAGVDRLLTEDVVRSPLTITNTRGIHATPVSEVAIELMIMLAKKAQHCFRMKLEHRWDVFVPDLLRSQTIGIVGLGAIGTEIARISKALGMKVLGVRRTAKKITRTRYVDIVYPRTHLTKMLTQCDYIVMVLPYTPETHLMIGEKELKAMKSSAHLINVGRGRTVDEDMLIDALEEGWIAGAGLDALTIEPLPASSKLWDMPNVIITPHVGGRMHNYEDLSNNLFIENLKLYVNGRKLRNVVNKRAGY